MTVFLLLLQENSQSPPSSRLAILSTISATDCDTSSSSSATPTTRPRDSRCRSDLSSKTIRESNTILEILRDGEHCVCHMQAHLGFRQVYISQQLAVLRDAGLLQDRRDGWNIYYHVTDERIYEVLTAVQRITGHGSLEFKKPRVACNCPRCSSRTGRCLK